MACGGLLSVLKGQKEVFFFDVSDPNHPKFMSSTDPPQSAITDEFYALEDGGFPVTMMGGAQGHHPGHVVEFDKNLRLVGRIQSARDLRPLREESDGHQRLHLPIEHAAGRN